MPVKILVVDDDTDVRTTLSQSLSMEGYTVATAFNGKEAIDFISRTAVDLVVTDMNMPKANGLQVLKAVKERNRNIEVIILTGYGSVENAVKSLKNDGAYSYFTKPLDDLNEFLETVSRALERRDLHLQKETLVRELHETKSALQQAHDRYLDLYQRAPMGYLTLDIMGHIRSVNHTALNLLGYTNKQLLSIAISDLMTPEDRSTFVLLHKEVHQAEEPHSHALQLRCKTGEYRWFQMHCQVLPDTIEEESMRCAFFDINERKQMQNDLKKSKQRYERLVNTIPSGVQEIDIDGVITFANPANHEMFGMPPLSLVGRSIYDMYNQEAERQELREYMNHLIHEKPVPTAWTGVNRTMDGRLIDVQTDWDYQLSPTGQVTGFISVLTDVTERNRWERKLKEERDRLESITKSLSAGLMVVTPDRRFEWVNQVIHDRTPNYASSFCHEVLCIEKSQCTKCPMLEILAGEVPEARIESQAKDENGKPCWYEFIFNPIFDEQGQIRAVLILQLDISANKRAAEERLYLEKALITSQKNDAISNLAGGIAHRFNNSLAVVIGNLELMKFDKVYNPLLNEYQDSIQAATTEMTLQAKKLLAYAKGGKYSSKKLMLDSFVRKSLPNIRYIIEEHRDIDFIAKDSQLTVEADPTQLELVLSTLIQNAAEATTEGCGRISLTVAAKILAKGEEDGLPAGRYACLNIKDNGCGMDEKTRQMMFEPYFSTKFAGRGLGLAAVQGVISSHNGHVQVVSSEGAGTAISIYLPLIAETKQTQPIRKATSRKNLGLGVLIIEDEEMVLKACEAMLSSLGCQVWCTEDATSALNIMHEHATKVDLILLDLILPDMDAKTLFLKLRAIRPESRIVLCSGYDPDGPAQEILNAGAIDFLQKPYSMNKLEACLQRAALL